jgi:hypothetical protein
MLSNICRLWLLEEVLSSSDVGCDATALESL